MNFHSIKVLDIKILWVGGGSKIITLYKSALHCKRILSESPFLLYKADNFYFIIASGNIGGQLGLFIGCSFLTAIEFLECLFMSTIYHCKRSGRKRNQKKKEWTANPDELAGEKNNAYTMDEMNTNNHNNNGGTVNNMSADAVSQPRVRMLQYGGAQF